MSGYKIAKFAGIGAAIFLVTYYFTDQSDTRLVFVGLIFAAIALLSANITNVLVARERHKTRLKNKRH